jgi:hypothetical protein
MQKHFLGIWISREIQNQQNANAFWGLKIFDFHKLYKAFLAPLNADARQTTAETKRPGA